MTLHEKAVMLKTLGHPLRLRIVAGLAGKRSCVKEIWECLGISQAVVSQHLRILKDHGILDSRREGARVRYFLRKGMPESLVGVLGICEDGRSRK